jgi:hypothetical protein
MAITIITQVTEPRYSPAGNPLVYVVDSDNKTEPNFRYVANVSINGNLVAKLKTVPSVTNSNYGRFNFQEIVRGYFEVTPRMADGAIILMESFGCPTQYIEFDVEFDEEYTGATPAPTDAQTAIIYNGAWTVFDFVQFPTYKTNYWIDSDAVNTRLPLTNRPQSTKAYSNLDANFYNQSGYLYFLCNKSTDPNIDYIRYRYYDSENSLIREYYMKTINYFSHSTDEENEFNMIAVPFMPFDVQNIPADLNSDSESGFGSFPIFPNIGGVGFYTVTAFQDDAGSNQASIEYTVRLTDQCVRFDFTEIHFENQLGGVDSYVFTKPNRERQSITRVEASRPYLADSFQNRGIYGDYTNFSKYNAQVDYNKEFTVSSDWLTDEEFEWLAQMVRSPRLWLRKAFQTGDGVLEYLVPILVTDTSYNVWKRDFDQLHTLTITYKFTFDESVPL